MTNTPTQPEPPVSDRAEPALPRDGVAMTNDEIVKEVCRQHKRVDGDMNLAEITLLALELRDANREAVVHSLREHHAWHLAQTTPDPEYGYIPAVEYEDSSMCERTLRALSDPATGGGL